MNTRTLWTGALALSAVAGANAQSTVTIYGRLDVAVATFDRTRGSTDRNNMMNSDTGSSSMWGLRGTEDLGGGLTAIFNLESPIDLRNGAASGGATSGAFNPSNAPVAAAAATPSFWRRNAFVGLRGAFGQVTLGRAQSPAIALQLGIINAQPSGLNTGVGTALQPQGITNDFWNSNQIRYDSPKFGGFDFAAAISLGQAGRGEKPGSTLSGVVRYVNGPLSLSAGYQKDYDTATATVPYNGRAATWYLVGASYAIGNLTLRGFYDKMDNDDGRTATVSGGVPGFVDSDLWSIGATYKATSALTVSSQYFALKETFGGTKSKQLTLNAMYALSRRSQLYAMFGYADSGNLAMAPLWGVGVFSVPSGVNVVNDKNHGLAIGMRHLF